LLGFVSKIPYKKLLKKLIFEDKPKMKAFDITLIGAFWLAKNKKKRRKKGWKQLVICISLIQRQQLEFFNLQVQFSILQLA
jgi:hypothetical protein